MNKMSLKQKISLILFIVAVVTMPLLSEITTQHSDAWAIAANHSVKNTSVDGAIIIGTAVNIGWALGALCGVQLVVGLVVAG